MILVKGVIQSPAPAHPQDGIRRRVLTGRGDFLRHGLGGLTVADGGVCNLEDHAPLPADGYLGGAAGNGMIHSNGLAAAVAVVGAVPASAVPVLGNCNDVVLRVRNSTLQLALDHQVRAHGNDVVQLNLDGVIFHLEAAGGLASVFNRAGRIVHYGHLHNRALAQNNVLR